MVLHCQIFDHHWGSVGSKSPVNKLVHFLLHLSRPKHRSWQTHSLLVTGGLLFLLYSLVMLGDSMFLTASAYDWLILRLLTVGLILGIASHLFLDFINPSGIHLYPGFKIRLVPRLSFFSTGGPWETYIIYNLCLIISGIAFLSIVSGQFDMTLMDLLNKILSRGD
jgi:membrane-bound metal-dependent hydrolase YbcI (DUF457 family)